MKKKVVSLCLMATCLLSAFTACGGAAKEGSGKKQSTITFWHNYSAESKESKVLSESLIPKFEKEHPEYKVEAVSYSWEDLHSKILIAANSNKLPDVARLDIAWIPEFQKLGILLAADQEMSDFKKASENLLPNAMGTAKIKDHYYGLSLNANSKILFYNKEAFEKASITAPKTMDEMFAAAGKLSGKDEKGQQKWGLSEPALSGWNLLPYIWSAGGSITDKEYKKASGYLNSADTVSIIKKIADLYKQGQFSGFNNGDIAMTDGFGTGRYDMILEGPWKIAEMKGAYPDFKYETAPMPAGKAGSISILGGEDISAMKGGNKEGAWEFMKFMTDEFAQVEMAKCGQIPVNTKAMENDSVKNSTFAPFLAAIQTAGIRPPVAKWTEIDNQLSTVMTSIIRDGADAQTSLDKLSVEIDKLLAE